MMKRTCPYNVYVSRDSGNTYRMLKELAAIGSEARFAGSTRTPPLYFKEINVVG